MELKVTGFNSDSGKLKVVVLTPSAGVVCKHTPYGFDLYPKGFCEWQISYRTSPGQDGRTKVAVILSEVDGGITVEKGTCLWDDEKELMSRLIKTATKHWLDPINVL